MKNLLLVVLAVGCVASSHAQLNHVNGRIGIGTKEPKDKLHVRDAGTGGFIVQNNEGAIRLQTLGNAAFITTTQDLIVFNKLIGITGGAGIAASNHTDLPIRVGGKNRFIIKTGGNVGIGTSNPAHRLDVNGDIRCESVRVVVDVPNSDHVFADDYKLLKIEEVKEFVQAKKHLPEIPSAAEFKANGYNVGEMDDLLLRKVEELTLYIIQLKEEIEALKAADAKAAE